MNSNAALKMVVTNEPVEGLLAMQASLDASKKRYEILENAVKVAETEIIHAVEHGAEIQSRKLLIVRSVERRYPSLEKPLCRDR